MVQPGIPTPVTPDNPPPDRVSSAPPDQEETNSPKRPYMADKFQAAIYKFVAVVLAATWIFGHNPTWLFTPEPYLTGQVWPVLACGFVMGLADYAQLLPPPFGTTPTHDSNS